MQGADADLAVIGHDDGARPGAIRLLHDDVTAAATDLGEAMPGENSADLPS